MSPSAQDERLTRENTYLKQRNAQLQEDVTAVTAEVERLRQMIDRGQGQGRTQGRTPPNPLGGGQ